MYSWELKKYIEERNHYLKGQEINNVVDPVLNPQISHVKYNPFDNVIQMWDKEGNYFYFTPAPYEEKNMTLTKKR